MSLWREEHNYSYPMNFSSHLLTDFVVNFFIIIITLRNGNTLWPLECLLYKKVSQVN